MSELKTGDIVELTVARVIDTGYVLTDGETEVLLHQHEATEERTENDVIKVFLYHSKKEELIATTIIPRITFDCFDWAEVKNVKPPLGVFVDIGTSQDILVSSDDLPLLNNVWPIEGDQLYVALKHDKKGRLLADPVTEADFEGNWDIAPESLFNEDLNGRVFRTGKEGSVLITEEGYRGFIHHTERKREPRLGEWINGRVIKVKEDGSLNMSLLPRKLEAQGVDAEMILNYLQQNDGTMPFDSKSDPESIRETFDLSKAAFKRALGKLYKERLIDFKEGITFLVENDVE
ncbi:hypothetical protein SAMN05421734_102322 [Pelagirhabdus alkalitolerans]|uniref:S1 motif domain-containing protein n=1 Tax=Pelagirhabdus alkalitolerans TaxID=1612202 RepID=A0A1G6H739_9BACI|nr:S1-like domain-containing RNA-binding protein [Pelagirhabdus alkalitolerans]SDB90080.1 hypothetical protein SAMN05421734_102322 [Pelagirhabdus alkalitolerans]